MILSHQLLRQLFDPLEIKGVEKLERENNLLQLNLPGNPLKDSRPTSHRQISVLVGQIRPLHRYVTVVSEVEAVNRFVAIALLFWIVLDQNADTSCYSNAFLQVSTVNFVAERD